MSGGTPTERTRELRAADGVRLHLRTWPAERPRATLLFSHGLGEHGGRYARLAADLVAHGLTVHALDHRGHGQSGGVRAYTPRFAQLVDDLELARRVVADPALPSFLYGHSLGGLIATRWLEAHPEVALAGAVLSAPLLGVAVKAPRWKVAASGFLSAVFPKLTLSNEIDPAELSTDPAYPADYRSDPLVHDKVTPRLYTELMAAIGAAFAEGGRISVPLLFLVPGADTIVREDEVRRFAAGLAGDVTVREYPGFRHEPHNELGRERLVTDVLAWIDGRLEALRGSP